MDFKERLINVFIILNSLTTAVTAKDEAVAAATIPLVAMLLLYFSYTLMYAQNKEAGRCVGVIDFLCGGAEIMIYTAIKKNIVLLQRTKINNTSGYLE
jgi:hypothetical protein